MSGVSHLEPKFRGMRRNNHPVKLEEKRLQKLLDFIDNRMQDQRSKLRRQIEDTQQSAEEMEEKKHKATLQLLKNYFEVTSGRVPQPQANTSKINKIHDERMMGVLSEPSLAIVPEVDPDVLSKPRSMYDRLTRTLDTSRLPLIAPNNRNIIGQSKSLPASMPNSNRSEDSSTSRTLTTPHGTPSSTPRNDNTPSDSTEDSSWSNEVKKPIPLKSEARNGYRSSHHKTNDGPTIITHRSLSPQGHASSQRVNGHVYNIHNTTSYDNVNGYIYQKGTTKPISKLNVYEEPEAPTPRLSDLVSSKNGVTRHSSLRRPMGRHSTMAMSTMSLSDLQQTRKQQAASKLKHALKGTVRVPR